MKLDTAVTPQEANTAGLAGLLGLVSMGSSPRVRRAVTAYALGTTAWKIAHQQWTAWHTRESYTVAVPGTDGIYDALHAWLLESLPEHDRRSVSARTEHRAYAQPVAPGGALREQRARVTFTYDSTRPQTVLVDGHRVRVEVDRTSGNNLITEMSGSDWARRLERIVFTCPDVTARAAVLTFLDQVAVRQFADRTSPSFFLVTRWGEWENREELGLRSIDQVVLRDGQAEELVDDLAAFLTQEAAHVRLGLPWHRGYLFHGPPGTGKTSLARALANHFDLDVYYVPLSDLASDTSLMQIISRVRPGSMLLLEDVDVLVAAHDRDTDSSEPDGGRRYGITLSGLLNSLDGLATPHGLITVMTTNQLDVLDPALVRPGRVDRAINVDYLDDRQLARMLTTFLGDDINTDLPPIGDRQIAPALVVEHIKRHLTDPASAVTSIKDLLA